MTAMISCPEVLVGLVGHNPASLLVVARSLSPKRTLLIATPQTIEIAKRLARQIPNSEPKLWSGGFGIDRVRSGLSDLIGSESGSICLDITGATKPLSIGLWATLNQSSGGRLKTVYLEPSGQLTDADTGQRIEHEVAIAPREMLVWYEASAGLKKGATGARWEGELSCLEPAIVQREALTRRLFDTFVSSTDCYRRNEPLPNDLLQLSAKDLPPGASISGNQVVLPDVTDYLGANHWLEEYCALVSRDSLTDAPTVRAAIGLPIATESGGSDEADVVLLRGPRAVIIEAKARGKAGGAGTDMNKRIQKARRFFGSLARVIFVHPAWGQTVPQDLAEIAGPGVWLVGRDPARLRTAIREALSLPDAME